ncbi:hypothetical protein [Streptomyces sp. 1222.5]|uniref:hypothetical protein n=1 Tax=Streptomyces sp. 1222.5 TaxID=1881026 RepID=UPI003EC10559
MQAICRHHGPHKVVGLDGGGYVAPATLYRNLVKELAAEMKRERLSVTVKGGDWMFGLALVDNALTAIGARTSRHGCSARAVAKSHPRGQGAVPEGSAAWMLNTRMCRGSLSEYADRLLHIADVSLGDPRHFCRS